MSQQKGSRVPLMLPCCSHTALKYTMKHEVYFTLSLLLKSTTLFHVITEALPDGLPCMPAAVPGGFPLLK